jgi:hypothetical protein
VDERSFDNLAQDLAASAQSRRAVALATVGLVLSLAAPNAGETEAARRRQARRNKRRKSGRGKQGSSGKGQGGHQGDCGQSDECPPDPKTGERGFACPDGLCSCGGGCCAKGYACFVGSDPTEEVCCFDDEGAAEIPDGVEFAVCPGAAEPRDTCCKSSECKEGECHSFTPGRYRRNPR